MRLCSTIIAGTEKIIDDTDLHGSYTTQTSPSPSMSHKSKGSGTLRSIFGKLRRSNSGNLEDLPLDGGSEFRRGGIRATACARLGWNNPQTSDYSIHPSAKPFAEWDTDAICVWFDEMGLSCYEDDVRKWLKNGAADLIKASPIDLEKEINLKSPLHRKKITLALADAMGKETDELSKSAAKLDLSWVILIYSYSNLESVFWAGIP